MGFTWVKRGSEQILERLELGEGGDGCKQGIKTPPKVGIYHGNLKIMKYKCFFLEKKIVWEF